MRRLSSLLFLVVALALLAGAVPWQSPAAAQFEKLKSLVGEWDGRNSEGQPVHASYKLISSGTVLQETLNSHEETDMVTVYHLDGASLMMTHYCAANNQPRMRAEAGGGEQIVFSFVDVTNLASPDAGHMRKLAITFQDADHFTQEWTWQEKGEEKTDVFQFTRKK